jgi:hypothetical protein
MLVMPGAIPSHARRSENQRATHPGTEEPAMPRYLVERTFPAGLGIPVTEEGATKQKTYCIYDGPHPEAIRKAAKRNGLPVDSITRVTVLDPYFYR